MNGNLRSDFPISPHLILNTLNFIYNSVLGVSPKAAHGIMVFSEVMRYAISPTAEDGKVFLDEEVRQIKNIIELNQIRFNSRLPLNIHIDVDTSQHRIPPFILSTFAENVFKHGYFQDASDPAVITMRLNEDKLIFSTRNRKRPKTSKDRSGIGTKEAIGLLETCYSGKYNLDIDQTGAYFSLELKIGL